MRLAILTSAVLVAFTLPATADILRSCSATIEISLGKHGLDSISGDGSKTLATLTAKGSCKNKANADKCRARARQQLNECLDVLWKDHRFDGTFPSECTDGTDHRPGTNIFWEGIRLYEPPRSLFREMVHQACCFEAPDKTMITLHLGGTIFGGPGCAKSIGNDMTQSDYGLAGVTLDCNRWRTVDRICDRP